VITGYLLSDRYQVGDVVGEGGMSVVLRGRDMRLDRDVAIKVLRADLVKDEKYEARFRHEASNAASLNHPAIVGVYDTGETDDEDGAVPFIVMEYVNGETLREALAREGEFPTRRALEIAADICAALDFSHRHGIVHRNISPKNVMLDTTGAVKVMDFGVARALAAGAGSTSTSAMVETAEYLSPEQARGEPVDARSDVYSVGCVLDEMLTGKPPFTARSAVEVADQHVHRAPTAPSEIDPGISPDIDSIVLTALAKSPLNRYQTAAQMRTELSRALAAQRIRTAEPRRLDWRGFLLTAFGVAALVIGLEQIGTGRVDWAFAAIALGLAAIVLAVDIGYLLRARVPLLDLRTLKIRSLRAAVAGPSSGW